MLQRQAAQTLIEKAKHYPAVAITGPRQSGKSTIAKLLFPNKSYCNLEDLDLQQFALEDPRAFLAQYPEGAILDEIQRAPHLFSYLQSILDADPKPGRFVLTGSQQFGLLSQITQSLAGRVGLVQLLPFSWVELQNTPVEPLTLESLLWTGMYPPIYDRKVSPTSWYSDYVMTYLERDVRQLLNVQDLHTFNRFVRMCAARTGQLLNLSSLASDCGISHNTAKAWLNILEGSYILFRLQPHHKNFNKRLIKSPKLYFYDTGLVCLLLGIENFNSLHHHPMRGALFETWVIGECIKYLYNKGVLPSIYFWRDSQGHEVDILIEKDRLLIPVEIKAGQTISTNYFTDLRYFQKLNSEENTAYLLYAGEERQIRSDVDVFDWRSIGNMLEKLFSC